jgi:haloalkane dehalogenase
VNNKSKVLLVHCYVPNDLAWGEDMYDLMTSRLARGHGPFQMTSHCHYLGLYLIAENISNPTTVLENPHWDEFDAELDKGYDVVGFQLKSLYTHKVARMMKRIREKCPGVKIVVGGYGVSTLDTPPPGDVDNDAFYIRDNADYLCREEGVKFMRRILNDEPVDREITQYTLPMPGVTLPGLNTIQARAPMLLVSLGCPNGCDFCNTSAFFKGKKYYVAEPEQIYKYMKHCQKRLNFKDIMVMLFDEDLYQNPEYVRELGRLIRSDKRTWGMSYSSFGSMRSLASFTPEELKECGVGQIWIGVESFMCGQDRADDPYKKRKGEDIKTMFRELHRHGIQTVGSLVLGFDFHTRENLKEDIDQFVALKPLNYQVSPLTPCPGTDLYERLSEEGRIYDTYRWQDFHLWKDDAFELKNFEKGEIKEFFDYAHKKISDELGPPVMQLMESALDSYQVYKDATDGFHAYKAKQTREMAYGIYAYMNSIKTHHHSEQVRTRAAKLEKRYRDEIGGTPILPSLVSRYISRNIKKKKQQPPRQVVSDPPPRWTYYNTFGNEVWVKKGRDAKDPAPYQDRGMIDFSRVFKLY